MITRAKIVRLVSLAVIGLCMPTISASAQQSTKFAVDSVSRHLKSHPKPKKEAVTPLAANRASATTKSKAKREVPPIILPATQPAAARPAAKGTTAAVTSDSVPAVRRAAAVSKKKPSR